jgi:hypothetical protein
VASDVAAFIDRADKPANIPSCETIILRSLALRPSQTTATNISGVRITLENSSHNEVSNIWVKFGRHITEGEAKTQGFVPKYLEDNDIYAVRAPRVYLAFTWGSLCFIVMEYIDEKICDNSDIHLIAAVVKSLITIRAPAQRLDPSVEER